MNLKVSFLGGGNIAEAIARSVIEAKLLSPEEISVSDVKKERLDYLVDKYKVNVFSNNKEAIREADVIILSVKPVVLNQVIDEIKNEVNTTQSIISVVAGINTTDIEDRFNKKVSVIRAMPNMPVLIREGISAISLGKYVQEEEEKAAFTIFKTVGEVVKAEESLMNAITALSGSGPAYVFTFIEALVDAGVELGISREISLKLVTETIKGAVLTILKTGEHPVLLKEKVTSPGGTTIAALNTLEESGFRSAIIKAVKKAAQRASELSAEN